MAGGYTIMSRLIEGCTKNGTESLRPSQNPK